MKTAKKPTQTNVELPDRNIGPGGTRRNLEHCLDLLLPHDGIYALGFVLGGLPVVPQHNYRILLLEEAERMKKFHPKTFDYRTLDELLAIKQGIEEGTYRVTSRGHIRYIGPK